MKTHLLLIDPQNDFIDLPAHLLPPGEAPALPVSGAYEDSKRAAKLIRDLGDGISSVTVTLDTHMRHHIAHPGFWMGRDRRHPKPFTTITPEQIADGTWSPLIDSVWVRGYASKLAESGKYQLTIWPVHCQVGSWGHNIVDPIRAALNDWQDCVTAVPFIVQKGYNQLTENYSAIAAEVQVPSDPATHFNWTIVEQAMAADRVLIAGQALSHCVRATVLDLIKGLEERASGQALSKLVLLNDCTSPVAGFEEQGREFLDSIMAKGVIVEDADEVAAA